MMRIFLLEPYFTGSHQSWAEGYAEHSRHAVRLLTMPGYFWKWRMHGGAVTLAAQVRGAIAEEGRPDLVLATDFLDVTTLLALTRDCLGQTPVAFYFHENQLTYPPPPGTKRDLHYGWINYASSLASQGIYFNSRYHLERWYDELPRLLKHFPDYTHLENIALLRERSAVLHPGVALAGLDAPATYEAIAPRGTAGQPPLILWNHRWEFDKQPQQFFAILQAVAEQGMAFRLAIAGESFRKAPQEFMAARETFHTQLVHFGYATEEQYHALLQRADIVISTALHEFFGIATVEAIYAGCVPLLPHRLAYPELIPPDHHTSVLYSTMEEAIARLGNWLRGGIPDPTPLRTYVRQFDWSLMAQYYDNAFESLVLTEANP